MKKKVTKIEAIKFTAERGERKGQEGRYVALTLENRGKNWIAQVNKNDDVLNITRPQRVVDMWLEWADELEKTKKPITEIVPAEFLEIDNVFRVNVPLDQKYYRLYRKTVTDSQGKVLHKKGDLYTTDDGTPQVYDSLNVLAIKYEDDDTGEMSWLQEPSSIVRDMINRGYYRPVVANSNDKPADVEPAGTEAASDESPVEEAHTPTTEELQAELARLKAQAATAGA